MSFLVSVTTQKPCVTPVLDIQSYITYSDKVADSTFSQLVKIPNKEDPAE